MRGRHRTPAVWAAAIGLAIAASVVVQADSNKPGVTDFTEVSASVIEVDDLTEALAPVRGTRLEPTVRLPVYFEFDSAQLRPDALELLDKVSVALSSSELGTFGFSVEGHTDSVGSNLYNQDLSQRRAAAVKTYLVAQGVNTSRLGTVGHGESAPFATNGTDEGRRRNRRVEVINLGASD